MTLSWPTVWNGHHLLVNGYPLQNHSPPQQVNQRLLSITFSSEPTPQASKTIWWLHPSTYPKATRLSHNQHPTAQTMMIPAPPILHSLPPTTTKKRKKSGALVPRHHQDLHLPLVKLKLEWRSSTQGRSIAQDTCLKIILLLRPEDQILQYLFGTWANIAVSLMMIVYLLLRECVLGINQKVMVFVGALTKRDFWFLVRKIKRYAFGMSMKFPRGKTTLLLEHNWSPLAFSRATLMSWKM